MDETSTKILALLIPTGLLFFLKLLLDKFCRGVTSEDVRRYLRKRRRALKNLPKRRFRRFGWRSTIEGAVFSAASITLTNVWKGLDQFHILSLEQRLLNIAIVPSWLLLLYFICLQKNKLTESHIICISDDVSRDREPEQRRLEELVKVAKKELENLTQDQSALAQAVDDAHRRVEIAEDNLFLFENEATSVDFYNAKYNWTSGIVFVSLSWGSALYFVHNFYSFGVLS